MRFLRHIGKQSAAILVVSTLIGCGAPSPAIAPTEAVSIPPTLAVASTEDSTAQSEEPTSAESAVPTNVATPTVEATSTTTLLTIGGVSTTAYRLPLTVQHVTKTTATLFFELDAPSAGTLVYAPAGQPNQQASIALNASEARQQITLENLSPGMAYEAWIGLGAGPDLQEPSFRGESWGAVSFHTPAEGEPLRVGVVGDSGFGEQITYDLAAQMAQQSLDFVIHTGDLVYRIDENTDAYEAYALKWYAPLEPLLRTMPVYPVVGNHDVEEAAQWEGQGFYYHVFPPFDDPGIGPSAFEGRRQWYAFAYGTTQFVVLDTQVFYNEPGRVEQDAWLTERLADPTFEQTIVAFHIPPFSSSEVHPDDGAPVQSWLPLFGGAHVPVVLSGHSHNYERLVVNGVTYVVSGGGSSALYQPGEIQPGSQIYVTQTHTVVLEIFPDRIDLIATAATGETLDQVSIPLR